MPVTGAGIYGASQKNQSRKQRRVTMLVEIRSVKAALF
jgi:hypothetical protein